MKSARYIAQFDELTVWSVLVLLMAVRHQKSCTYRKPNKKAYRKNKKLRKSSFRDICQGFWAS